MYNGHNDNKGTNKDSQQEEVVKEEGEEEQQQEEYDIVKSGKKFKFLLQRFLTAICHVEHKVVLFLDDIQWIDTASLDLVETIILIRPICIPRQMGRRLQVGLKHVVLRQQLLILCL